MRRALAVVAVVLVSTGGVFGGLERGNRSFRAGEYAEAVAAYQEALTDGDDSPVLRYNLGTALLKLGRYAEAEEHLRAALTVVEPETRERVHYNLGQRYLEDARASQDPQAKGALYDAAVEAYRQALRLRPTDGDAKWNYELALQERDEQQQGGGGGEGGDKEEQQQQPDEQEQDPQGGSGQGQSQGRQDKAPSPRAQGDQAPMSQEQAERILSAVEQDERELFQDKLRKGQQVTRPTRDW